MNHEFTLITTVAAGLGLAFVFGLAAARLRMPPLVGYLLAGIVVGPHTPGFVADVHLAGQLAEIGVMLLMFGVGLHFSLDDLARVRAIAIPGALFRIVVATAMGAGAAMLWGWPLGAGIVFGLSLSIASTVVLLRALESRGTLLSFNGRIAVGWVVVEDLVTILVLVLLPPLAGFLGGKADPSHAAGGIAAVAITLLKVAAFVALMLIVGRRVFPRLLWMVAKTGSRELFTLCVAAAAVGVAYGSAQLFGVSFALGAFFAGMMMRESALSHRAAEDSLPLQDAFSVLFFVSVGMLFDPAVLLEKPLAVLTVVAIVMFGKTLAAVAVILLFRYPLSTALTVSGGLAQIGEFSFILAGLSLALGIIPAEAQDLILAGALISIALNPLMFAAEEPVRRWILARSHLARMFERSPDPLSELPMEVDDAQLTGQVVLVGYGRVGSRIAEALTEKRIPFVVVEANREKVERLRARGRNAVSGDASDSAVLIQGHVARAAMLVIATPDTVNIRRTVEVARMLNPKIEIVIRTHSDEEAGMLRAENAGTVFIGEHELALGMTRHIVEVMERRDGP